MNGKYYLGMHSTDNLEDGYIGSGKRLWYSIRKYGRENFKMEIQEFLPDRRSLKEREKEIVNEGKLLDPMCMNLMIGGEGGIQNKKNRIKRASSGGKVTAEKFRNDPEFHKTLSNKFSELTSKLHEEGIIKPPDWTGKHHSEKTRKLIGEKTSLSQQGEKNSQFGKMWIINKETKENKRIKKTDPIPEGWIRGRNWERDTHEVCVEL